MSDRECLDYFKLGDLKNAVYLIIFSSFFLILHIYNIYCKYTKSKSRNENQNKEKEKEYHNIPIDYKNEWDYADNFDNTCYFNGKWMNLETNIIISIISIMLFSK